MKVIWSGLLLLGLASAAEIPANTINLFGPNTLSSSKPNLYVEQYAGSYYGTSRYLTVRDLFEKPMFVLTLNGPSKLTAFYLLDGLKSVSSTPAFNQLHHFMKEKDLYGVIFYPQGIYNARFFNMDVHETVLPDKFKMGDALKSIALNEFPVLFIVPKAQAQEFHFDSVKPVFSLGVYDDIIEPIHEAFVNNPLVPSVTVPVVAEA